MVTMDGTLKERREGTTKGRNFFRENCEVEALDGGVLCNVRKYSSCGLVCGLSLVEYEFQRAKALSTRF